MKLSKLLVLTLLSGLLMGCGAKKTSSSSIASSEPEIVSSESEVVAKTAEDVVTDINGIFNPLVGSDIMNWYEDYECYIGGLNLGAAEHATDEQHATELQSATEFIASYLPEYLEVKVASFEEEQDDYAIMLGVDEVIVGLFGYVNGSGNIIVQIQIA